jgi:predicted nucleic acid-binding protein
MTTIVVDANVFVANLRPSEPHHAEAAAFLAYAREKELTVAVPIITPVEVAGAIARGTRRAALGRRAARLLLEAHNVQLVLIDESLAETAVNLAADHQLRGYDAIYLALAQQLAAPFVTLDAELMRRKPNDLMVTDPTSYSRERR